MTTDEKREILELAGYEFIENHKAFGLGWSVWNKENGYRGVERNLDRFIGEAYEWYLKGKL
jgi:hypothetical protein